MTDEPRENEDPRPGQYKKGDGLAAERVAALAGLFEGNEPSGPEEDSGPLYWPALTAVNAGFEWDELRTWVEELLVRFSHLDHHVIPRCWFRHNGHVEALVALRDHERVVFDGSAPGSAAVDWHRAFRDIESRLREWTAQLACGATHEPRAVRRHLGDADEWDRFVSEDLRSREYRVHD